MIAKSSLPPAGAIAEVFSLTISPSLLVRPTPCVFCSIIKSSCSFVLTHSSLSAFSSFIADSLRPLSSNIPKSTLFRTRFFFSFMININRLVSSIYFVFIFTSKESNLEGTISFIVHIASFSVVQPHVSLSSDWSNSLFFFYIPKQSSFHTISVSRDILTTFLGVSPGTFSCSFTISFFTLPILI